MLLSIMVVCGLSASARADFSDMFNYSTIAGMQTTWGGYGGVPACSTFGDSSVIITPGTYPSSTNTTSSYTGRYGKFSARFMTTNNETNYVYLGWMSRDPWANPGVYVTLYDTLHLSVRNGTQSDNSLETPYVTTGVWHTVDIIWEPGSVELVYDGKSCGKVTNTACIPTTAIPLIIDTTRNVEAPLELKIDQINVKPVDSLFSDDFNYSISTELNAVWSGYGGLPTYATLADSAVTIAPPSVNSECRLTSGYTGVYGRLTARFMTTNNPGNYFNMGWISRDPWSNPGVSVSLYDTLHLVAATPGHVSSSVESPTVTSNVWHTMSIVWKPGSAELIYDGLSCGEVTDVDYIPNTALPLVIDVIRTLASSQEVKIDYLSVQPLPSYYESFHLTDGKPFFPICSWAGYPVAQQTGTEFLPILIPDSQMDEMRDIGFNTMRYLYRDNDNHIITNDDITHALDRGLRTLLVVGWPLWAYTDYYDPNAPSYSPAFKNDIDARKDNPGLFAYETMDEPMCGYYVVYPATDPGRLPGLAYQSLSRAKDMLHDFDGSRPVLYNEVPYLDYGGWTESTYTDYLSAGDAYSQDFYPYTLDYYRDMWGLDRTGMHIDFMRHCIKDKYGSERPLYYTLQGASFAEMGLPADGTIHGTYGQQRMQAYDSLVHGIHGLTWFALAWMDLSNPDSAAGWSAIKKVVTELGALQNVWAGGETLDSVFPPCRAASAQVDCPVLYKDANGNVTTDPTGNTILDDFSIQNSTISLGDDGVEAILKEYNGQKYLVVVNTTINTLNDVSISVAGWGTSKTQVLFESRGCISTPSGAWTDDFAPQEVHVYTTRGPAKNDFDGDGKSDIVVFVPDGNWYVLQSSKNWSLQTSDKIHLNLGASTGDEPFIGDFDGDGKADIGLRNNSGTQWIILKSSTNWTQSLVRSFGSVYPTAVGDLDGDGLSDIIEFWNREYWKALTSSTNWDTNQQTSIAWGGGNSGNIAVPGDYDGDGITDAAYYLNGTLNILNSSTNASSTYQFGYVTGDKPVTGDFDGDGKDDPAIYRNGEWRIYNRSNLTLKVLTCGGAAGDIPITGDYDGDGKTDIGVYNAGSWRIALSSRDWSNSDTLVMTRSCGAAGIVPVNNDYAMLEEQLSIMIAMDTMSSDGHQFDDNLTFVCKDSAGNALSTRDVAVRFTNDSVTKSASGTCMLDSIPGSTVSIWAKGASSLWAKRTMGILPLSFSLVNGDCNGDNRVNALDLAVVKRYWNQTSPSNPKADLNRDGRCNATDLALVKKNWNAIGDS